MEEESLEFFAFRDRRTSVGPLLSWRIMFATVSKMEIVIA
jgi:hypothetical protein